MCLLTATCAAPAYADFEHIYPIVACAASVHVFSAAAYAIPGCVRFIETPAGRDCSIGDCATIGCACLH
jgi:hypothetical protein